ncbi:general transcriptional corepressor trfA-like isoform X2 [Cydia pomonella]|nr:general transcriptional corepressor trfA-like isoform X2 [Cydia pomonella]
MSGWRTKADLLKDLNEVNGRRTGIEHLDQHVVSGERPPPICHEIPDENEMDYFFRGHGASGDDGTGPDLAGISTMLKLVSDLDETKDNNDPITLFRNRATDEIRISKLNPNAGEYIPGSGFTKNINIPKYSPKKNNNIHGSKTNKRTGNENIAPSYSNLNETKQNGLPNFNNNMFKSKSVKNSHEDKINATTCETKHELSTFNNINMFKSKSVKDVPKIECIESNTKNVQPELKTRKNEQVNTNGNLLVNGLPKRQIEKPKADEMKELQEKVKSTIIASSVDNSLQTKRQKNVAIATLLKLGVVPDEKPVKLIKPDYFEKPPTNEEQIENKVSDLKEMPSTSSSETNVNYVDPDSISKVNGWFNSMECPKPKPQLQEPLVLKDCITFKKKTASSVTSRNTSTSTTEPTKDREAKSFKPSDHATELLKKYETNAQQQKFLNEDLGTRLERQLRERDEVVRQKMLARQNAG